LGGRYNLIILIIAAPALQTPHRRSEVLVAGSRGRAPVQGSGGVAPLKLNRNVAGTCPPVFPIIAAPDRMIGCIECSAHTARAGLCSCSRSCDMWSQNFFGATLYMRMMTKLKEQE